ncbi:MAG: YkgJ family cysteine cluster protein [Bermanella sp.]
MKECNSCGKCCIKYSHGGLTASRSEIELWDEDSPQISRYVHAGKIWVDPTTHAPLELCPWLKEEPASSAPGSRLSSQVRYSCEIYYDRPDDCRFYPSTLSEMIVDECEMIEAKDIKNPKQAQLALEHIMADSWGCS